jgi:Zn-dependent protease with chaperone function
MATDFFDRQDDANRQTGRLVFLFGAAVMAIILTVYAAFTAILVASNGKTPQNMPTLFDPTRLVIVAAITGSVILLGSLFKIFSLREGGAPVARSLGGRLVEGNTSDLAERRLLNIVEEMALASGTPVPAVYVLDDEHGINAFAAGYAPGDAVIGVTRGAIDHLDRDQLQGVIAHEFSHVLNGDMRLDTKLMGTLHGILLLALIGGILMRIVGTSGSSRSSRDDDKKDNGAMAFFLMGLALYIIGYIGVFFGRLIKSAVSRQREFLADASAVQFTRNPEGIAGALKKIGGLSEHGLIKSSGAEEASHMFFGAAIGSFSSLMASHPPLEERIKRLDPNFDGVFPEVAEDEHVEVAESTTSKKPKPKAGIGGLGTVLPGVNIPGGLGGAVVLPTMAAVASVGEPKPEHMEYAANLIASLPPLVVSASRDPFGAASLIYATLLDPDPAVRARQLDILGQDAAPGMAAEADRLAAALATLGPETRLPIVDLAIPALRGLSNDQYDRFRINIMPLIQADQRVSLFEFALERVLFRHLDRQFRQFPPVQVRYAAIGPLLKKVSYLLATIATIGQEEQAEVETAYRAGLEKIGPQAIDLPLPARQQISFSFIDSVLNDLAAASPPIKRRVLEACAATIGADGRVTVSEGELLRAIADSLDCPMPPLLSGPLPG